MVFSDIVAAADGLSPDEQLALVEILQRSLKEHNRQALLQDVAESRDAFAAGECQVGSVQDVMDELQP